MRIVLLFLFQFSLLGYAQTLEQSIKSLEPLTDSAQADSMARLSRISAINDLPEIGIQQAKWSLNKAKQIDNKAIVAFARFYIARNFNQNSETDSALVNYLKALEEIKGTKYDVFEIYILSALGNNY